MKVVWNNSSGYTIKEIKEPNVAHSNDVKIKVRACGLCGSDIHKLLGGHPIGQTNVLGHEIAGEIVDTGKDVTKLKIGDKVTINPIRPCYSCSYCTLGLGQFCQNSQAIGKNRQGGFAEYICVNEDQVLKLNNNIHFSSATLLDSMAVALHTLDKLQPANDSNILIVGDGSLALLTAILADKKEFNNLCVVGKHDFRLNLLKNYNTKIKTILFDEIKDNELKDVFDVGVEIVGGRQSETIKFLVNRLKPTAKLAIVGVFSPEFIYEHPLRMAFYKELAIMGVNSYSSTSGSDNDFIKALNILEKEPSLVSDIVTHEVPLSNFHNIEEILQNKQAHQSIKIVITN